MNTFAKMMIAGTLALSAATVSAGPSPSTGIVGDYLSTSKTFSTTATLSKEAAYQMGLQKLNQVNAKTPWELARVLPGNIVESSAHVDGKGYIHVVEQMNIGGNMEFVARVTVPVNYQVIDSDR
ncbi:MAG: hypothetical protein ACPGSM_20980 [Thiolinea sp.]